MYAYDMAHRTTVLLDEETRTAARQLAMRYGCSTSEAIRRAIVRHRVFDLFEGNDPVEETRRLKAEDEGF